MADNYLEKQYEQYEARKAAWEKAKKYGKKKSKRVYQNNNCHSEERSDEESDTISKCIQDSSLRSE
ncbi:MAG: hypothetical protein Q4D36_10290 [Bacteroidales bacterium]|nr:hypothetical protein [Bacteroidales bacterium]